MVVAPWAAWAAVRLGGLERGHPWTALLALTPYAAATGWLPVLVAAGLRRRAVAAAAALAWAVLVVAVVPRAFGGPTHREGERLVVMTANLLHGDADARRVLELVDRYDVDVLSLQELTTEAVRLLDAAGAQRRLPGRVIDARPSAAGSGVLARWPLERVPTPPLPPGAAQPEAALTTPGGRLVHVQAVHPYPPVSADKTRWWRARLAALRILAGDFNATLDHGALRAVLARGYVDAAAATGDGLLATWPARGRGPSVTIDHVLVPEEVGVRRVRVREVAGSDHRAVIAEVVLPRAAS